MFVPRIQKQEEIIVQQRINNDEQQNKPRVNNNKSRDIVNDDLAEQFKNLRISRLEQKLAKLEERDKVKRKYELRMDYSQIQCYKCNEMGHFTNKCEEFSKRNRRNNNQRNNNRRINIIEELCNEYYESSDNESSDDEINDDKEVYAYEMYMKRRTEEMQDNLDKELEEGENKCYNKQDINLYDPNKRPSESKKWVWSKKKGRWYNKLEGLDNWHLHGSPKKRDETYGDIKSGKDNITFEQLLDITKQQAKYIKKMGKINNKRN
jgi:hypothetical protein